MLKKSASSVLAVKASSTSLPVLSSAAALLDGLFEHPVELCSGMKMGYLRFVSRS
jgi:hypothetical protein